MVFVAVVLLLLAIVGHGALWVGINNRWHGVGLPRKVIKSGSLLLYAVLLGLPVAVAVRLFGETSNSIEARTIGFTSNWATAYLGLCAIAGGLHIPVWALRRWRQSSYPDGVRHTGERVVDMAQVLGAPPTTDPRTKLFCKLPYNHLWEIHVSEFEVALAGLPAKLEGLVICHISDLHFSYRIERLYYEEIVRLANGTEPDLVALTGDVCDKADRIPWIVPTLGALRANVAKLSVLGNHDLRTKDVAGVRAALTEAGFQNLGGRVAQIGELPLVAAGNEYPWFPASIPQVETLPSQSLKLLLSHSPDQFGWAQRNQFDLMLAGHTHGGQIRFPLLGPIVCPSLHGTKYASGFFQAGPTLLHVSRGTGSLFPYRLNCRPQVVRLVLRSKL